jgi:hypothetical protein
MPLVWNRDCLQLSDPGGDPVHDTIESKRSGAAMIVSIDEQRALVISERHYMLPHMPFEVGACGSPASAGEGTAQT